MARIQQVQGGDPTQAAVAGAEPPQPPPVDEAQAADAAGAEEVVMVIGDEVLAPGVQLDERTRDEAEVAEAEQRLASLGIWSQEQDQPAEERPMSYCIPDADRYRPLGS